MTVAYLTLLAASTLACAQAVRATAVGPLPAALDRQLARDMLKGLVDTYRLIKAMGRAK